MIFDEDKIYKLIFYWFIIGNTIHTMTGQEAPIMIINKIDNYYSYEAELKEENAQAELFQELSQQKIPFL